MIQMSRDIWATSRVEIRMFIISLTASPRHEVSNFYWLPTGLGDWQTLYILLCIGSSSIDRGGGFQLVRLNPPHPSGFKLKGGQH